jgi:hypothetical protein
VPALRVVRICSEFLRQTSPGSLAEVTSEAVERAKAAADALGNLAAGVAPAARAHRLPVNRVVPHLGSTAVDFALRRVALGRAHQVLQRQLLEPGTADHRLHAIKADPLLVEKVEQQGVARHHRLEIRKIVRNLG